MNAEKFDSTLCYVMGILLDIIPFKNRGTSVFYITENLFHLSDKYQQQIKYLQKIFEFDRLIFGEYGELGNVVFLNKYLEPILTLAFEYDGNHHCMRQ